MGHGDAHHMIGRGDDFVGKAIAFGAHDDGQAVNGLQYGIVKRDRVFGQCHGSRGESLGM